MGLSGLGFEGFNIRLNAVEIRTTAFKVFFHELIRNLHKTGVYVQIVGQTLTPKTELRWYFCGH